MSEKAKIKYPLAEATMKAAAACRSGLICLQQGPSCRVGAVLNRNVLIVDCRDQDAACPFYQAQSSMADTDSRGLCSCRVRHALWEKFGL